MCSLTQWVTRNSPDDELMMNRYGGGRRKKSAGDELSHASRPLDLTETMTAEQNESEATGGHIVCAELPSPVLPLAAEVVSRQQKQALIWLSSQLL